MRDFRYVDDATRYAFGSICFCIPRQRRDMSKAKGIYLISNWCEATIYRVRAKREHIEFIFREIYSLSRTYFTKVNISTERKTRARIRGENPSILALSFCKGAWVSPYMHLTRQMRCLHFCQSVNSPLMMSPYLQPLFTYSFSLKAN